jgi:hypothetical protein
VIVVSFRPRVLVIGLVGAIAVAIAAALWLNSTAPQPDDWRGNRSELATVAARTATGSQVTLTDNLTQHRETVRIGESETGLILDPMDLECHGGRASVTWTVGNLEPIDADTGIHLSARLDGVVIGSILRGSTRGIWNDTPVTLIAVANCPPGRHTLDIHVDAIQGRWGIPYVVNDGDPPSSNLLVNRGFVVREVWG